MSAYYRTIKVCGLGEHWLRAKRRERGLQQCWCFVGSKKKHKTNKQKTTFQYAPQKAVSYSEASKSLSHLLGYTGEMRVQTGHITSSALSVSKWETLCQWCPMASWGQEQWTDLHNVTLRGRFGQCWYFNGHCYCNVKGANWSVLIF